MYLLFKWCLLRSASVLSSSPCALTCLLQHSFNSSAVQNGCLSHSVGRRFSEGLKQSKEVYWPMLLDYACLHCSIHCQILIWIPKTFPFPSDGVMFPLLYIARSHSLLYWSSFVDLEEIYFLCYHSLSSGSHLNNLCVFTLVSPCRLLMVSDPPWLELSECLTLFDLGAPSTLAVIVY